MSRTIRVSLLLFGLLFDASAGLSQMIGAPGNAVIHARAVNVFGDPLNRFYIDKFADENGIDYAPRFQEGKTFLVPYGTYRVEAFKFGFRPYEATIEVTANEIPLTLCFETEAMESTGRITTNFNGRIEGYRNVAHSDGVCRASGVYLRLAYEATLNSSNLTFSFGLVGPGSYTVLCKIGSTLITLDEVRVGGGFYPFVLQAVMNKPKGSNPGKQ